MDRQKKIANVLETYFSDANLLWDKTLQSLIKSDNEGYVSLERITQLPKMKVLEVNSQEIKEAATEYSLTKLQLSDKRLSIKRIKPFVLNKTEELNDWSIYVEGLEKAYQTEHRITDLFKKHVGSVSFVRIPADRNGQTRFHGFCFVEFDNRDNVQKAVDTMNCYTPDKSKIVNREIAKLNLRVMSKHDWLKYQDEYLTQMEKASNNVKKLRAEYNREQHKKQQEEITKGAISEGTNATHGQYQSRTIENTTVVKYPKGVIVFVQNIHPKSSKTAVKTMLEKSGASVAYIKHKKGLVSCHVRLSTSEDTSKLLHYFKTHHITQDTGSDGIGKEQADASSLTISVRAVTGKEEEIYWLDDPMRDRI